MSKRSRWPKCPGQKWPTRSSDEDFPCLIAFFITSCCLWKLTFVVEGAANVISALSWHPPCWDFTNEKLTQNLRPEQKSLKYTNINCVSRAKYYPLWNISQWAKLVRIYKCIGNSFCFLVRAENAVTVGFAWRIEWEYFCKLKWSIGNMQQDHCTDLSTLTFQILYINTNIIP